MLAYAPRPERRHASPAVLSFIIGAHVLAIAAAMSAKMEVIPHRVPPTIVDLIPEKVKPKPAETKPDTRPAANPTKLTAPDTIIPLPPAPGPTADPLPPTPLPPLPPGPAVDPVPTPRPLPVVHTGARFITPAGDVRPPYPEAMRVLEKEATLRLRLSIDERGRVTAVEPVGKADPAFLAAARRHIIKAWRYAPAMEGDHAIPSTTVVTLAFRIDA